MIPTDPSPFDALAGDYDQRELDNPIMQIMRTRSLAILDSTFPAGNALLDVGCGTGTEAIWLAQRGRAVLAVDSSAQMLDVLSRRAQVGGVRISTWHLRAGDLATLVDERGRASFDGAYSSFGALNMEPSLDAPMAALSDLVRPGGRIVLSVMNRWCVAEMAAMVAGGRPGQALRRVRPSLRVAVGTSHADVTYPSWYRLRRILNRKFRVLSVQALTLLLLPYAWPRLAGHPRIYRGLSRVDDVLSPLPPFSWLGDHLLLVALRRSDPDVARNPTTS